MIKIRPAQITDGPDIVRIWAAGWQYAYKNIFSKDFLEKCTNADVVAQRIAQFPDHFKRAMEHNNIYLVALDDERVIGYVTGGVPESKECKAEKELGGLYINPKYIGQGVGKLLVQSFARAIQQQGAKTFGLMCFSENPSMAFYKKMGGVVTVERNSSERYENAPGSFIEFNIDDVLQK